MDGRMKYGCTHYRRRCKIKAPCCGQIFSCRHCHNEAWKERSDYHVLNRRSITQVICSLCQTEQQVAQFCSSCGECMGEYFCGVCNFFDDDISKEHFHCDGCGDCRTGGRGNFFHCSTCGACYATGLFRNHICIPNSTKDKCLCCVEPLDSREAAQVLQCGHTIHVKCFDQMIENKLYRCLVCHKSVMDMSNSWDAKRIEREETIMPPKLVFEVRISCNDCSRESHIMNHLVGLECSHCGSFNTILLNN